MDVPGDVTCKFTCENSCLAGKNSAFLAVFSSGSVKNADAKEIKFWSYENSQTPDGLDRKRTRKILVIDTGRLQYHGLNYGTQASQRQEQCRYFVGVQNKKTGLMTVHSVQPVHCVPLLNTTVFEDEDGKDDNFQEKSYTEKMDLLTSAFGTKRKRQAMESRLNYATENNDEGTAVADSVELNNLGVNNPTNENTSTQKAQAIPPQNASATMPHQVYNLKDIISEEEYFAIEPFAKVLTEATSEEIHRWKKESVYGELVLQNLQDFRSSLDLNKAKLLVYYNFMLHLLKLTARDIKRKDPLPHVPEPFKRKLLERFTLSGSTEHGIATRNMTLSMKDKIMSHAMVLALFIEDFRIELQILQSDFRRGQPMLIKIANAVGCTIINQRKNNTPVKVAELKIPLFVPSGRFSKKK